MSPHTTDNAKEQKLTNLYPLVFVFCLNLVFISRCMERKGLWQRRAFQVNLFLPRTSLRTSLSASQKP